MRNPVPAARVDAELWDMVKAYCDKKGIRYRFFLEEALRNRLKKLKNV